MYVDSKNSTRRNADTIPLSKEPDFYFKEENKRDFEEAMEVYGKKYPCLVAARNAYTHDPRPHLFILAIPDDEEDEEDEKKCNMDEKKCNIYVINFELLRFIPLKKIKKNFLKESETDVVKEIAIEQVLTDYDKVMKNLKGKKLSKKDAEDMGKTLFKTLIPDKIKTELQDELKNESKKVEWWVWIYSDVECVFNPIWEWLYTSPKPPKPPNNAKQSNVANHETTGKNSSSLLKNLFRSKKREPKTKKKLLKESTMRQVKENNKEDGFFWGDRFFLSRVHEKDDFKKLSFNIHKVANILLTPNCLKYAEGYSSCLKSRISAMGRNIDIKKNPDELKNFDHIYVGADASFSDIEDAVDKSPSLKNALVNPNFVFLNIFTSGKINTPNLRSKLITLIPAKTRICPSFSIPPEDCAAQKFINSFSESVIDEKNVVKAATKAREKIRQDSDSNLWRLVYIVEGNPFTEAEV
jgi:hypothetical protein